MTDSERITLLEREVAFLHRAVGALLELAHTEDKIRRYGASESTAVGRLIRQSWEVIASEMLTGNKKPPA